jgi:hypothetical protein
MLGTIGISWFAAGYAVALVLEVTRLYFRSGVRGAALVACGSAAWLLQSLYLLNRLWVAQSIPLSSAFDWYLVTAWFLAASYLYLTLNHPRVAIGIFLLPPILTLIGVAAFWADTEPFPQSEASLVWGSVHGIFLLLGTVHVIIGFAAGLMYLVQADRLKRKQLASSGMQLPSLEWLARVNARAIIISALMLAAGLVSGVVLNLVNHRQQAEMVPWSDPVVLSSTLSFCWMVAAALFTLLYRPARVGRKVAYLTIASFAFLVFTLGVSLFVPSEHSPRDPPAPPATGDAT